MRPLRTLLALIGLVAIVLTYVTRNLYFLIIAVAALFAGFYLMGAARRGSEKDRNQDKSGMNKSSLRKNRKQD